MEMVRKIVSTLLITGMLITFLPSIGWAAEDDSTPIDLSNESSVQNGEGWNWDSSTNTLTLNGCNLSFDNTGFILPDGATVAVSGENTIQFDTVANDGIGIKVDDQNGTAGLKIQGPGSLTLIDKAGTESASGPSQSNGAIYLSGNAGDLSIENVKLTLAGGNCAVRTKSSGSDIIIENAMISTVADPDDETNIPSTDLIYASDGNITVKNSTITANNILVREKNISYQFVIANQSDEKLLTIDHSNISATVKCVAESSQGIFGLQGGSVEIKNSSDIDVNITITDDTTIDNSLAAVGHINGLSGIHAVDNITISNSDVTAIVNNQAKNETQTYAYGFFSAGLDIKDSNVDATAQNSSEAVGIAIDGSTATISSSTFTATAETSAEYGQAVGYKNLSINEEQTAFIGCTTISSHSLVKVSGKGFLGYGLECNDLTLDQSEMYATGTGTGKGYYVIGQSAFYSEGIGVYPAGNLKIQNNSRVEANGHGNLYGYGISTSLDTSISNSSVIAYADDAGDPADTTQYVEIMSGTITLNNVQVLQGTLNTSTEIAWITDAPNFTGGKSIIGLSIESVSLDKTELSLTQGEEETLFTIVKPENATLPELKWSSSDPDVAKVDENGLVSAIAPGQATITVTTSNGLTATCAVSVISPEPEIPEPTLPTTEDPPYTGNYNYPVTVDDVENGNVLLDKADQWATGGERVTFSVAPDEAYLLESLTITDKNGNSIEVTDNNDGTFTFTMPESAVTITATFAEDPNYEPDPELGDELPFIDVSPDDWFYDPVVWAYSEGLMTGTSATTFEPNTSTTRGMIVAILHRLENGPTASGGSFTDVASGDWYADAVNWAASVGIVAGFEDGSFRPNDAITREQMAAILCNYAQWKGMDTSACADLSSYSDQPSAWAQDVMEWAVGEGLISGTSATTLDPQAATTRAQTAAIFQRFLTAES